MPTLTPFSPFLADLMERHAIACWDCAWNEANRLRARLQAFGLHLSDGRWAW